MDFKAECKVVTFFQEVCFDLNTCLAFLTWFVGSKHSEERAARKCQRGLV
jgi:hypothetical protein